MTEKECLPAGIVKALGLVFGDIGTSPIYTLSVVFLLTRSTPEHVIGVLALIVWTLVILVSLEYGWLAMSLGERGEGGTIVLKKISEVISLEQWSVLYGRGKTSPLPNRLSNVS